MMGARYYRPDASTKLKKCSEHIGTDCTDCCSVTPCAFCLELEIYGQDITYGHADDPLDTKHWTGTVSGYSFDAYWERNYTTDVCEFVVLFDGEEVYRQECGYISCRDSSAETEVTIGYDSATLRWIKHEPLPLPHVTSDTGRKTYFCGTCECSCECLCVIIRDNYGEEITRGEICTASGYPCDGPVWQGPVGDYELSLALGRDTYGDCIITATVNGSETGSFAASGCKEMTATIELDDGKTAEVACKVCACITPFPCCPGMDYPTTIPLTVVSMNTECACIDGEIIPMLLDSEIAGRAYYNAIWAMPCVLNGDPTQQRYHRFQMNCGGGDLFPTLLVAFMDLAAVDAAPTDINDVRWGGNYVWEKAEGQCDPFYFRFDSSGGSGSAGNTNVWGNCGESSMDVPWIEFEATL